MTLQLIAALRRAAVVLALLAPMMLPVPVHAQGSNEWANCREVTDPDVADRMQLCSAHAGCKLVLKVYRSCTAVRGFLDRLGTQVGEGVRTLFGTRREVQPEHIWEAVQTEDTKQLDALAQVRRIGTQVREGLGKSKAEIQTGTSSQGLEYAIIGPKPEPGATDRWAMRISSDGEILRGQYLNNRLHMGDAIRLNDRGGAERVVGTFNNGVLIGQGAQVNTAGTLSEGFYNEGRLTQGTRRYKSGEREEGLFEQVPNSNITSLASGKKFNADGTLREEGSFREGRLFVGDRYANGQLVERVDEQRQQRERIEAQQAADLERQRREREQRQAEAAAREQRFQQDLQRMNAGELYALADQLREQREADRARQVLRALITRFPNHPLAAAAADALSPARPGTQTAAQGQASPASSTGQRPAGAAGPSGGAAQAAPGASGNTAAPTIPPLVGAAAQTRCAQAFNTSEKLAAQMKHVPPDSVELQLRAVIEVTFQEISNFTPCVSDPAVAERVMALIAVRNQALAVCRQISSTDRCLISPFEQWAETRMGIKPLGNNEKAMELQMVNQCRAQIRRVWAAHGLSDLGVGFTAGSGSGVQSERTLRQMAATRDVLASLHSGVCAHAPASWVDQERRIASENLQNMSRSTGAPANIPARGTCGNGRPVPVDGVCTAQ